MNKIGVDFGTSFSTSSWINPTTRKPEAILFHENGMMKMPSVVYFSPEGIIVGQPAYDLIENSLGMQEEHRRQIISSVVMSIKRNMQKGESFYSQDGGKVTHEEIIAEILKKIRLNAQITCYNNQPVEGATITHPVVFQDWQKEMLKRAAGIAGFTEIRLLEEPVAAALGYAVSSGDKGNGILVYDFGGGTFDVAYVQRDETGHFRVPIEPEGEAYCGGDDIDEALYDRWEQLVTERYNRTISSNPNHADPGFRARCRKHKESMTIMANNFFAEVLPPPGFHRAEMQMTRPEFDRLIEPVIEKTVAKTERLLNKVSDAGYRIDTAIMIGGSSRIPLVYDRLKAILPVEPRKVMQVDVAVALGAILHEQVTDSPQLQNRKVYCIYCGRQINMRDRFCIYCGRESNSVAH